MMEFSYFLFGLGFFFVFTGIVGVLRLPDFYSRLHAVGKSDTLGVALMLTALAIADGISWDTAKIGFILVFILVANPTATHALGRAAFRSGLEVKGSNQRQMSEDQSDSTP